MTKVEVWREIPGWDGYEASSLGKVRSWRCPGPGNRQRKKPMLLSQTTKANGYKEVLLYRGLKETREPLLVHRLVLMAFAGLPAFDGAQASHLNGKRDDNRPENLVWSTAQQNTDMKFVHGTVLRGEDISMSKLTELQVKMVRTLWKHGFKPIEIARQFGITNSNVLSIVKGRTWAHVDDRLSLTNAVSQGEAS